MSVNKTWNNTVYSIPNTRGESGWEQTLSSYLQALADNAATTTFNKQAVRKATTTPVTVSASTDCTIIVDLTGPGASTVNLPAGADKQIFIIVDGKGDASTNNITIDANGSETIEGSLTKVIRLNRECLVLQYSSSAGDWKVIGGYVPNMIGGPASSTDNAIVRFDGTTGKLVQNSGVIVDDSNNMSAASYTATGGTAANNTMYVASNVLRLRGGTSGFGINNTSGTETVAVSDAGAVTLGPSSGSGLIHKLISNSKLLIGDTGTMEFRDRADTVTLGSVHTATGAWTFGAPSGTTEFGHSMTGYRTTATSSVLYIRNRETTTASDDAYDIICNKGSTTNTSSQGFIAFYVNDGGTPSGHITANGAGAATFNAFSDLRLKENIQPLQGELLKILSLNPVEFDYKDGSGHQIGFIAQEVEQVYPDTINVLGETEKMKTIAGWDKTSARLVKAIQELKAELDAAKARIEALENK
jgi:hypothetical protein